MLNQQSWPDEFDDPDLRVICVELKIPGQSCYIPDLDM
jgi:hypothetical protein